MAAPENIKISGIAWQDERSARRAVVNDFLMKEGNVVSGAKILEIKQDRVRFSLSGSTFEVPLLSSATAMPGAGK
jgi:general secretion pathway protein B